MQGLEQLLDPNLVADVINFAKEHPIVSGTIATWMATTEGLPFVKRFKSSGLLHLAWNLLVTLAGLVLKINKLRSSGKDGEDVGTRS